jgi:SRSO17 transposase
MGGRVSDDSESRFAAYVEGLSTVIGHADRVGPLRDYCVGLMMPGERKSVEPMAAVTAPARTAAQHQSLLHFVGQSAWSDTEVLAKVGEMVLPKIEHHGAIEAWIIDDTGFPKKGEHSVGVARQYCGRLGKTDNCQVAVSLSLANHHASLPVAYQLYLPEEWSNDRKRLRKVGVPEDVGFKTKPEIALEQIAAACAAGLPRGVVLMDAAYGNNSDLRSDITALQLTYAVGILSNTTVWAPGTAPLPAKTWSGRGRPPKRLRRDAEHQPISVKDLALGLPKRAWRTIVWRQGSAEPLSSRFARVRVHAARRDFTRSKSRPEEWLLIEWPKGELDLDPSRRHRLSTSGRSRQITLADRARLSGTQARGWPRAFRRPRMARLSSSRHAVHRRLRLPGLRAGDDSPLRLSSRQAVQDTCRSQGLPTQRLRRCAPNDTFRTRLRQPDNA